MQPTIGRTVLYTLTEHDAKTINKRRADFGAFRASLHGVNPDPGHRGATGHVAHYGNRAYPGDVYPAVLVRVWDEATVTVNARVLLDGTDTLWVTSRPEGDQPGQWHWPPRV